MEQVDVRDLPEEQAQMVQAFVEFLRQQMGKQAKQEKRHVAPFSVWNLGAKGHLSRTDIYERI